MNISNIQIDDFPEYILCIIFLSIIEFDNKDFILNKNKSWKEFISFLKDKNAKTRLLKYFFRFPMFRRVLFQRFKNIFYTNKNDIHDVNLRLVKTMKNENELIESVVNETLNVIFKGKKINIKAKQKINEEVIKQINIKNALFIK